MRLTRTVDDVEHLPQFTCAYCGGQFSNTDFALSPEVQCCMAECAAGYLRYIEGSGEEEHADLEEHLGRKIALPPPPQEMRHWDPHDGTADQADLLVLRLQGLSVDDALVAKNEVMFNQSATLLVKK